MMHHDSLFSSFAHLYSLSKTLRFELVPIGKTRETITQEQNLMTDQAIEDAYQVLKPEIDKLHEQYITEKLESDDAKEISFLEYFNLKNEIAGQARNDASLEAEEKKLRSQIGDLFADRKERLFEKQVLENIEGFEKERNLFKNFYTYFGGFNQNRENYYSKDDKSTAVSNRIINENLPKFVDNIFLFEKQKDEYNRIFNELKNADKDLKIKDKEGNEKIVNQFWNNIFQINYFNSCLSQAQIDDYNLKITDNNFLINLYNQQNNTKLPYFKILFKQIGCGEKKEFIKLIQDDTELKSVLQELKKQSEDFDLKVFKDLLDNSPDFQGFYWKKATINTISNRYFSSWQILSEKLGLKKKKGEEEVAIPKQIELKMLLGSLDENTQNDWKTAGNFFKNSLFLSEEMKTQLLEGKIHENELTEDQMRQKHNEEIITNSEKPSEALIAMIWSDLEQFVQNLKNPDTINTVLNIPDFKEDTSKAIIKEWLDNAINMTRILKYFDFPLDFDWFKSYDAVRNYLTEKPQSGINKLKLNFENSTLAGGWDVNKETDNYCIILQDENKVQYLVILKNTDKKIFEQKDGNEMYNSDHSGWTKMNYKLLPGPNKMLPKVLFSGKWTTANPTPQNIETIYKKGSFKKGNDFSKEDLHSLIDFYKGELKKYPSTTESWQDTFAFQFSDTDKFESIDQFYTEVEKQGYKLDFVAINKGKLDELVKAGKVYLFQIKNQDYNTGKQKGHKNNLHTIYWQAIFGNAENKPKLNGEAEIFYRSALSSDKMKKKTDKSGKEILENYRYAKEKFVFHCPITLNFCLKTNKVNDLINTELTKPENAENISFLGIDRGEKHLAYYSLVNGKGEILEQGSFNEINGQNYHDKLEALSQNRDEARKNWQTIGTIKELKDGYISQVVRKIVDLAIEHNAFIVLENLNSGFKNSRKKIEKSVYQKLELALAKKLNFVVDKTVKDGDLLSVQNALQLTPPVENFGDIDKAKQYGIMLYTRANYTSTTDPKTGWRKTIYLKKGSEESIKAQICEKFDEFGFDGTDYYFKYTHLGKEWTLYSGKDGVSLERYRGKKDDKDVWQIEKQDIVAILDGVFENFDKNRSFKSQILDEGIELKKVGEHTAWESLRFAIDLIQQIRNTGIEEVDNDFIFSPIRDKDGKHFDSRENGAIVPNGDANGAYNIARKGIIQFGHIKKDLQQYIADEEYDSWLMGSEKWEEYLKKNEKDLKNKKGKKEE